MSIEVFIVAVAGVLAGGAVNLLADELPRSGALGWPKYSNGERRPLLAWLGVGAFCFRLRCPKDARRGARPLGWRYPLAEIACSFLSIMFFSDMRADASATLWQGIIWMSYAPLLVLITVIDLEHRRIPFPLPAALASLAILEAVLSSSVPWALLGGLLGLLVFYGVFLGGIAFSRLISRMRHGRELERAFGFGDVILMASVGMAVGFPDILLAMTLTIILGALGGFVSLIYRYLQSGKYCAYTSMPYGPFISAAAIIVLLRW